MATPKTTTILTAESFAASWQRIVPADLRGTARHAQRILNSLGYYDTVGTYRDLCDVRHYTIVNRQGETIVDVEDVDQLVQFALRLDAKLAYTLRGFGA